MISSKKLDYAMPKELQRIPASAMTFFSEKRQSMVFVRTNSFAEFAGRQPDIAETIPANTPIGLKLGG